MMQSVDAGLEGWHCEGGKVDEHWTIFPRNAYKLHGTNVLYLHIRRETPNIGFYVHTNHIFFYPFKHNIHSLSIDLYVIPYLLFFQQ